MQIRQNRQNQNGINYLSSSTSGSSSSGTWKNTLLTLLLSSGTWLLRLPIIGVDCGSTNGIDAVVSSTSTADWPGDLPHSGNSFDEFLLSENSRKLKNMPKEVDAFLETVNNYGLTNVDHHLQVVHPVNCFIKSLSKCYMFNKNIESALNNPNNNEFGLIVVRIPLAYETETLGLFALHKIINQSEKDNHLLLEEEIIEEENYKIGKLLAVKNNTKNHQLDFTTFVLSDCKANNKQFNNKNKNDYVDVIDKNIMSFDRLLRLWYKNMINEQFNKSKKQLPIHGFVIRCLTCKNNLNKAAAALHNTGEMIIITNTCNDKSHYLFQQKLLLLQRNRRSIIDEYNSLSNKNNYNNDEMIDACVQGRNTCCVRHYEVDQGSNAAQRIHFIPQIVPLNLCEGHCADPSTAHTNRMSFINAIHSHVPKHVKDILLSQRCCSPQKWKPFTILYYDTNKNLQFKVLSNFTVIQCGCS